MIGFVERLTLRTWCRSLLPRFLKWRGGGQAVTRCLAVDHSRLGLWCARACRRLTGVTVEPLRHRLVDCRDERGLSLWLRVNAEDLLEVQADVTADPRFRRAHEGLPQPNRLRAYLAIAFAEIDVADQRSVWRALLLIQVCRWRAQREAPAGPALQGGAGGEAPRAVLFLERRPWFGAIERYAARWGMTLAQVPPAPDVRAWLQGLAPFEVLQEVRRIRSRWAAARRGLRPTGRSRLAAHPASRVRIAVDYYGHLNLAEPERQSNLFFWQRSSLPAADLVVTFALPQDPLDEAKAAELSRAGMAAIALRPEAAAAPEAQAFFPHQARRIGRGEVPPIEASPGTLEGRWLRRQASQYTLERAYWADLFASQGVKVYVSWFKMTEIHCAIADALQDLGGVTAIYHRSYELDPSAESTTAADIVFGFSPAGAEMERRSGSVIPYYVVTGYLGDHRFPLLRERAQDLREALARRGAARILAYCDENSFDEARWAPGHVLTREHHAFLLERLLDEPWLGLVLKPKAPHTLRRRLGPVAALLDRALATGRCVMFEGGRIQGSYPPAAAALAADVMVHGHLYGATAGVESALAGARTVLLDQEGWSVSPLCRLGVGRVVFKDWETLWTACREHWRRPDGIPGFGDWSSVLDELDPFRDGRAAERMGTYLQWLLEGFRAGGDREAVMADAAERYAEAWGREAILHVAAAPRAHVPAVSLRDADALAGSRI